MHVFKIPAKGEIVYRCGSEWALRIKRRLPDRIVNSFKTLNPSRGDFCGWTAAVLLPCLPRPSKARHP